MYMSIYQVYLKECATIYVWPILNDGNSKQVIQLYNIILIMVTFCIKAIVALDTHTHWTHKASEYAGILYR